MPPTMIIEEEEHADTVQEVVNQYEVAETQEVFTWLASLGGSGNIKVSLQRLSPKSHKGFPCGGTIDSFEQVISEEEIRDMHGGGKFQIRVNVPNNSRKKGAPAYKFGGSRTSRATRSGPGTTRSKTRSATT
jgi:hypothetical protein